MDRIPFGIERLDAMIGGGAPTGSLVLLSGDPGAGAREFMYTSAAISSLPGTADETFTLHYGDVHENATIPDEVHYVTFTSTPMQVREEMAFTMESAIVDAADDAIQYSDLSAEYFQLTPVPREWYLGSNETISDLVAGRERRSVLEALGDYLNEHAAGNLVCIDSLTDLVAATSESFSWSDVAAVMKGLDRAASTWDGLIMLLVNQHAVTKTQLGLLKDAADGSLIFEWEAGGSERARTMYVEKFRGVLSRLEEEDIVQFETEMHDGGFDISDVRKIR